MGIIQQQDQRPRDWAYKAVFKEKDLPSLKEMAKHIRETHDIDMIEDFNAKCEQKLRTGEAEIQGMEIQQITKTGDLVVNSGLQLCLNIILGTSSARFSHFGMSQGSTPNPAVTDTTLLFETVATRVALAWNEAVGMRLYFGGISSQTSGTSPNIVGEIGVYNSAVVGAILLNRSLFLADVITQSNPTISTINSAPVVVSSVIQFCPVT